MKTSFLCMLFLLGLTSYALADSMSPQEQEVNITLPESPIENAYRIRLDIRALHKVYALNIYLQFFNDTETYEPTSTDDQANAPAMDFYFDSLLKKIGVFHSADDVLAQAPLGFTVFDKDSDEQLAVFNLTNHIYRLFPNVKESTWETWHNESVNDTATSKGMIVEYTAYFDGRTSILGNDVNLPLWETLVVVFAVKFAFSFILALIDFCCQPLQNVAACGKFSILAGNTLWLFFGGFETGFLYWVAGLILTVTVVFMPFGVKLVRFAIFALFPFGREVRTDFQGDGLCSFLGNALWLILVGLPLVLLHFILGIALCILIVTIPFGLQHLKLAKAAFMPFGHSVVFREDLQRGDGYERAPASPNRYV